MKALRFFLMISAICPLQARATSVLPTVDPLEIVWTDGLVGTVPGSSITYGITSNHDAITIVSDTQTHDGEYKWTQGVGSNYQKQGGNIESTITFSQPIPVNAFTTIAFDFESGMDTISVSGGTATPADFAIDPGLGDPLIFEEFVYDDTNGQLTLTPTPPNPPTFAVGRHVGQLVGLNTNTMLSFTHTASGVGNGSGQNINDFTIINFGFIDGVAVPEPSSFRLLGLMCVALIPIAAVRFLYRRKTSSH